MARMENNTLHKSNDNVPLNIIILKQQCECLRSVHNHTDNTHSKDQTIENQDGIRLWVSASPTISHQSVINT